MMEFWNRLLPLTVEKAEQNTAFYRSIYSGADWQSVRAASDLALLPLVTRAMLREAGASACVPGLTCAAIQNTSGTTGDILFLYRSEEEFRFIQAFFQELISRADEVPLRPLILVVDTSGHGVHTPVPSRAFVLQSDIACEHSLRRTVAYLQNEYRIDGVEQRVTKIVGSVSQINQLTGYLIDQKLGYLAECVDTVSLTSDYLTMRNRSWLEGFWSQAKLADRYSMAECFGGATYCDLCRGFHFDPVVIPEIVTFPLSDPVSEGPGRLVLTSLYPFVQMQPLIRYVTDDIFEQRASYCAKTSYFYFGRVGHTLFDPLQPENMLIPGATLLDTLDEFVAVDRSCGICDMEAEFVGKPLVSGVVTITGTKRSFRLRLGLRESEPLGNAALKDLQEQLRHSLLAKCYTLADLVAAGVADFTVSFAGLNTEQWMPFDRQSFIWSAG